MLRLVAASLAGVAALVAGIAILGESDLARYGVGIAAMFVIAALAPHVFIRGDWPPPKSDRTGRS